MSASNGSIGSSDQKPNGLNGASSAATSLTSERELATQLLISPEAIGEAVRRRLLSFIRHRNAPCWRFGDTRNGCLRRLDGQPFKINGKRVKAEAVTGGESWHRLIGLDDVLENRSPRDFADARR